MRSVHFCRRNSVVCRGSRNRGRCTALVVYSSSKAHTKTAISHTSMGRRRHECKAARQCVGTRPFFKRGFGKVARRRRRRRRCARRAAERKVPAERSDDSTHLCINRWTLPPPRRIHVGLASRRRATCSGPSARAPRHRRRQAVPSSLCPSLPAPPHSASRPGGIQPRGRRLSPRCTHGPGLLFSFVCFFYFYLHAPYLFSTIFVLIFRIFFFFVPRTLLVIARLKGRDSWIMFRS